MDGQARLGTSIVLFQKDKFAANLNGADAARLLAISVLVAIRRPSKIEAETFERDVVEVCGDGLLIAGYMLWVAIETNLNLKYPCVLDG